MAHHIGRSEQARNIPAMAREPHPLYDPETTSERLEFFQVSRLVRSLNTTHQPANPASQPAQPSQCTQEQPLALQRF
jgi:hypothetical protein